ncbi:tetratricopeptide repeat protein [Pseudolabrys taiwanensis]|nr:tetratricopeptide repeat protein [Pseudolabrys taiwanensis]
MAASDLLRQGLVSLQTGNLADAERQFQKLLRLEPRSIPGLNLYSVVLSQLGRFEEAEIYLRKVINLAPPSDASLYNYATILKALGRPSEAIEHFTHALALNPGAADILINRAATLTELRRFEDALIDCDKALSMAPGHPGALHNKGNALAKLGRLSHALDAFEDALKAAPRAHETLTSYAMTLVALKRSAEALACCDRALALMPDYAEALAVRADILSENKHYEEALRDYEIAFRSRPKLRSLAGHRLHTKMLVCDWSQLDQNAAAVIAQIRNGSTTCTPFVCASLATSSDDQLQCVHAWQADDPVFKPVWNGERYRHDRIRLAYLSSDFHEHPVAYLTAGVFEHHDLNLFETTAISFGPNSNSPMQRRLKRSFEHFIDARDKSDAEAAELLHKLEIDIAVDLNGLTSGARPHVLKRRPAPILVNYLGYPGTCGPSHDYILADHTVIPEQQFGAYSEEVVWLPDSYLPTDNKRPIAAYPHTRSECGLPDSAFVFCCFNNTFKITPNVFDIWMRLLRTIDNSVLWLGGVNGIAANNLRTEAERRGISSSRLIFADRVQQIAHHLARQRMADLFLDTWPYNAHTTAADALWSGLPVLTCIGNTFPGRVATSLLHAVGLPELVTTSPADYEALALKLALNPAMLADLRTKLKANRDTTALFDTARFTRNIEAAYLEMMRRLRAGLPPAAFSVPSSEQLCR